MVSPGEQSGPPSWLFSIGNRHFWTWVCISQADHGSTSKTPAPGWQCQAGKATCRVLSTEEHKDSTKSGPAMSKFLYKCHQRGP